MSILTKKEALHIMCGSLHALLCTQSPGQIINQVPLFGMVQGACICGGWGGAGDSVSFGGQRHAPERVGILL